MVNGKPGDHPFTDIVVHGLPVFSPEIGALIVELNALGGFVDDRAVDLVMTIQSRVAMDRQHGHARQAEALLHDYRKGLLYHRDRLLGLRH